MDEKQTEQTVCLDSFLILVNVYHWMRVIIWMIVKRVPWFSNCLLKFQGHWICLTFLHCGLSNKRMIEWRQFEWSWKGFPGFSSCTLKFQGHCHREKAQHFLSKLATNIFVYPHLSQIFHPSYKYASLHSGLKHSHLSFHYLPKFYPYSYRSFHFLPKHSHLFAKSNFIPFLAAPPQKYLGLRSLSGHTCWAPPWLMKEKNNARLN